MASIWQKIFFKFYVRKIVVNITKENSFQFHERKIVSNLLQNFQFSWLVDPARLVSSGKYLGANTLRIKLGAGERKNTFSQENEEEEDASGKTIKDIEEEKKAEKEKQQK